MAVLFRLAGALSLLLVLSLSFGTARYLGWLGWPDAWVYNTIGGLAVALTFGAILYRNHEN